MDPLQLSQSIRDATSSAGFDTIGFVPAFNPPGFSRLESWLDAGYAGEMHYFDERRSAYQSPESVMEGTRSLVLLTLNYMSTSRAPDELARGRVARYAWGQLDYHDLIHDKFKQIKRTLSADYPEVRFRGVVDTAPLLEREFAQAAGLGWFGKNTMLINKHRGSWFFLAALLFEQELIYDQPHAADHCGTCTACLDACPTDAFPEPGVLDATRCISYLTIEHKSSIPVSMRSLLGNWVLGCDVCQDVCPWNRKSQPSQEPAFQPLDGQNPLELTQLFELDDDSFRKRFRKSPLWRPRRRGILRNAAIALGNNLRSEQLDADSSEGQTRQKVLEALQRGLNDTESLVRGASAWALGEYLKVPHAERAGDVVGWLEDRLKLEEDPDVEMEVRQALTGA